MWAEVASALGVLTVFGLVVRFQQAKLIKLDDKKVDEKMCEEKSSHFAEALARGDKRFEQIVETQNKTLDVVAKQTTTLALIQQSVERIEKNGKA